MPLGGEGPGGSEESDGAAEFLLRHVFAEDLFDDCPIDPQACIGCTLCNQVCPFGAITTKNLR